MFRSTLKVEESKKIFLYTVFDILEKLDELLKETKKLKNK